MGAHHGIRFLADPVSHAVAHPVAHHAVAHHAVAHHAVAHPVAHHAAAHPVAHHAVAHHAPHHLAHPVVHAAPVIHRSSYRILADPEGKPMIREGKSLEEEEMPMQMADMAEMKAMVDM